MSLPDVAVRCDTCCQVFDHERKLKRHSMGSQHRQNAGLPRNPKSWLCEHCGATFHSKSSLGRHQKCHTHPDRLACNKCSYTTDDASNLSLHMLRHHESKRNFVCEHCGLTFNAKSSLKVHKLYKHSSRREFSCDQCSATFKMKDSLTRHQKVHDEGANHICWCGRGFKLPYNLQRHQRLMHLNNCTIDQCDNPGRVSCSQQKSKSKIVSQNKTNIVKGNIRGKDPQNCYTNTRLGENFKETPISSVGGDLYNGTVVQESMCSYENTSTPFVCLPQRTVVPESLCLYENTSTPYGSTPQRTVVPESLCSYENTSTPYGCLPQRTVVPESLCSYENTSTPYGCLPQRTVVPWSESLCSYENTSTPYGCLPQRTMVPESMGTNENTSKPNGCLPQRTVVPESTSSLDDSSTPYGCLSHRPVVPGSTCSLDDTSAPYGCLSAHRTVVPESICSPDDTSTHCGWLSHRTAVQEPMFSPDETSRPSGCPSHMNVVFRQPEVSPPTGGYVSMYTHQANLPNSRTLFKSVNSSQSETADNNSLFSYDTSNFAATSNSVLLTGLTQELIASLILESQGLSTETQQYNYIAAAENLALLGNM